MFEIVYILLNKKRVSARELAEHLGVSVRTIYRDIDTISLAGIPIFAQNGRNGGISLLPDFVLNKSILNEQEQHEVLASLQALAQIAPQKTNLLNKFLSAFNKQATSWLEVDFSDWGARRQDLWEELKGAILQRRVTTFDYHSSYGDKTTRKVEPIRLWFKARAWYLQAFDVQKQGIRLFRLSRMSDVAICDEHFAYRELPSVDVDKAWENHLQTTTYTFHIDPKMEYRVLDEFSSEIKGKTPEGKCIVEFCDSDSSWLTNTILSFGEYIEVIEPQHMRDTIKEAARKIYRKYEGD